MIRPRRARWGRSVRRSGRPGPEPDRFGPYYARCPLVSNFSLPNESEKRKFQPSIAKGRDFFDWTAFGHDDC